MRVRALLAAAALLVGAAGCSGSGSGDGARGAPTSAAPPTTAAEGRRPGSTSAPTATVAAPTVLRLVRAEARLATLETALGRPAARPLADRLADPQRATTLFAPVDDGLAGMTADDLAARLRAHAVDGTYLAADLASSPRLRALDGSTIVVTVDGDGAQVGGARLVTTDLEAVNGVVHLVDGPVSPSPRAG